MGLCEELLCSGCDDCLWCVQGQLSGLCGNFDMKTVNEMRTPDNIDSPTPQEFGNSWTAAEVAKAEKHLYLLFSFITNHQMMKS